MNCHPLYRPVKISLSNRVISWKGALVKSKLKKSGLELDEKKYRPVSNLQFLSKLAEKAAQQAVMARGLFPELQSAYRRFHSTETASLRVDNDILLKMNKRHVTLLVFLDLSSARSITRYCFGVLRISLYFVELYWSGFVCTCRADSNRF